MFWKSSGCLEEACYLGSRGLPRVFQICFREVSKHIKAFWGFKESFKGVYMGFSGIRGNFRIFPEKFHGASRSFRRLKGSFQSIWRRFGWFKGVSGEFGSRYWRMISRRFPVKAFQGVSTPFEQFFWGVSRHFKRFYRISGGFREIQKWFSEVSGSLRRGFRDFQQGIKAYWSVSRCFIQWISLTNQGVSGRFYKIQDVQGVCYTRIYSIIFSFASQH